MKQAGYKLDRESESNRKAVGAVIEALGISTVYHGHYHLRYSSDYAGAWVEGLSANYVRGTHQPQAVDGENCLLLDW